MCSLKYTCTQVDMQVIQLIALLGIEMIVSLNVGFIRMY